MRSVRRLCFSMEGCEAAPLASGVFQRQPIVIVFRRQARRARCAWQRRFGRAEGAKGVAPSRSTSHARALALAAPLGRLAWLAAAVRCRQRVPRRVRRPQGTDGHPGRNGTAGLVGSPGVKGVAGKGGRAGLRGARGQNGTNGFRGPAGDLHASRFVLRCAHSVAQFSWLALTIALAPTLAALSAVLGCFRSLL